MYSTHHCQHATSFSNCFLSSKNSLDTGVNYRDTEPMQLGVLVNSVIHTSFSDANSDPMCSGFKYFLT